MVPFYFCNKFGKFRPILIIFFTVVFSDLLLRKVVLRQCSLRSVREVARKRTTTFRHGKSWLVIDTLEKLNISKLSLRHGTHYFTGPVSSRRLSRVLPSLARHTACHGVNRSSCQCFALFAITATRCEKVTAAGVVNETTNTRTNEVTNGSVNRNASEQQYVCGERIPGAL